MAQVAKVIEIMVTFGWPVGALALVAATVWSMLVYPTSRNAGLIWLIGAALNVPLIILSIRIMAAGRNFTPASEHTLLDLIVFYGVGAAGLGWLIGITFGSLIRVLIAKESIRPS
jgi:hypothetical protein